MLRGFVAYWAELAAVEYFPEQCMHMEWGVSCNNDSTKTAVRFGKAISISDFFFVEGDVHLLFGFLAFYQIGGVLNTASRTQ